MKKELDPFRNLKRIEFVITNKCTANCKHCSVADDRVNETPSSSASIQCILKFIENVCSNYSIESVMTFGGEPLLKPEQLYAIHSVATSLGVPIRQIITNGYFTNNKAKINSIVTRLKEAGVNNLLISVDAFHQETIPIEKVYYFAKLAVKAGIDGIKLHPAWVVNENHKNKYNSITHRLLDYFSDLNLPVSKGNNIILSGNAKKYLSEFYDSPKLNLVSGCGTEPYSESFSDIKSISIVPNGDVQICNFTIGNINEECITDILSRFNPYDNRLMQTILTGGIFALYELSQSEGIKIDLDKYFSVCDLCNSLVKKLS